MSLLERARGLTQLGWGQWFWRRGKLAQARKAYDRAIGSWPSLGRAYLARGECLFRLEEWQAALADYEQAQRLKPGLARSHRSLFYSLGMCRYRLKEYAAALDNFSRGLERYPKEARLYYARALTYLALGQTPAGQVDCQAYLKLRPYAVDGFVLRSRLACASQDYRAALADVAFALKLEPGLAEAYEVRGTVCTRQRDYAGAVAAFGAALDLAPPPLQKAAWLVERAINYLALSRLAETRADLKQALAFEPLQLRASWLLFWAELDDIRPDEAGAVRLNEIAALDPTHPLSLLCRAVAAGFAGRWDESLALLEETAWPEGDEWAVSFWRGVACRALGRPAAAIGAFEQARKLGLPVALLTPPYTG